MGRIYLGCLLILVIACNGAKQHAEAEELQGDSSLISIVDSSNAGITDSITAVADTTLRVNAAKLIGKWIQPVAGLDKEMQGFQLRKNGTARSINMYTLVYEKWELAHDTLLLWNHSEGVKDTSTIVDTTIIKELTDTSLILFPVKAAEGYREKYLKRNG
ncbi:lipocalin family protein [Chitinophaga polysaccharea]|uniref:lipocalin family protein n=1 Tax=Chitinophaga TaxID=79328 RepID=UPI001454E811|nr:MULTISPECIES: lipocalin family protein [Chitinophaga]NLR59720.1 lipocalin family protein [Chitinophaga polysaccharea]NLU94073.1 lipocalin family protein [Chitinophaga sp. Ak27]